MYRLPDFLVIGFPRCATTWLHKCLAEHPEIQVGFQKELHFFDRYWDRGIEWYANQFPTCNDNSLLGESTPNYILNKKAITRIASVIPKCKLIVIIRNPVDHVYARYWFNRKSGGFKTKGYEENISFENAIKKTNLVNKINYVNCFQHLFNYFERQQILILKYENIKSDPINFIQSVYQFIEVKSDFIPTNLYQTTNAVLFPKIQKLIRKNQFGNWIISIIKRTKLSNYIRSIDYRLKQNNQKGYPAMSNSTRSYLENLFAEHNKELEQLINIKLDW